MNLLDMYRERFGQAIRRQGNGFNGPCPLCGGQPGKSDRFMIWPERSDHLGEACAAHGIRGIWNCRKCGESGDTIAWLMKVDGLSFRDALGELGIEPERRHRRKAPAEQPQMAPHQELKTHPEPEAQWQEHALKLVCEAEREIWTSAPGLKWLHARGITDAAIQKYRLGYLPLESAKYHGRFRPRKSFGLSEKTGADGKTHDKIFIPRGILVPTFSLSGKLLNLRIRRHKTDLGENRPKYMELEGSSHCPFFLPSSLPADLAVYFITEAELDAILIHHASSGLVGAMAVRTNRGKPDFLAHSFLQKSARICIALDYDSAGAEGVAFWEDTYHQAMRWPVPEGKDPGDAFALGVDIPAWIAAALPESVKLPGMPEEPQISDGPEEALPSVGKNWGVGASPNFGDESGKWTSANRARVEARASAPDYAAEPTRWDRTQPECVWAEARDFTPAELEALYEALPASIPLSRVYLDVAVVWLLWRNLPITFINERDERGNATGFAWKHDPGWRAGHEAEFEDFWRHQTSSRLFWSWMSDHPAEKITAKNLLLMPDLLLQENLP